MAVVISAMAPSCTPSLSLHGSSRLSRASSGSTMPPTPLALAKKDAQDDTLFTDEEFQALMSGQCELLSFTDENDLQSSPSPSPLLSLQLQAQLLCRDDADAYARFQETPPPPPFALDDVEAPISDDNMELLAPLFCDEEIEALCAAPAPQQASSMQFSTPAGSDDQQAGNGKKRMPSSPSWPSCIADDGDEEEARTAGLPPPPLPPPTKKARTKTTTRRRREYEPLLLPPPPPPARPPIIIKKARTQTKSRISSSSREQDVAARADRLRQRLWKWHNTIANRILNRQFRRRAPELSRGRTALRCQCPELALLAAAGDDNGGGGGCALHQDTLKEDRVWMLSSPPVLVGGPGKVLVPAASAGSSKATVLQYARWRHSVSMPSRFYVERAAEKGLDRSAA